MNIPETVQKYGSEPLVSVGIPTYNRPEGLRRTLECIIRQSYRNLEIIVSDNCSPGPETEKVVRELMATDNRIQYFRQNINQGSAFNFKFVVERASGSYFMWASDDDEWDPQFIHRLIDCLVRDPDLSVAMSGVKRIDDYGSLVDITRFQELLRPDYNQFRMAIAASRNDVITYYMYGLFRISAVKKICKNLDNSFGRDKIIICELLISSKFGYVDELLHIRHIHSKGTAELYSQEEVGKNYADPFNYMRLFLKIGPYLLLSDNIPLTHKLWVPFMVIRQGIWTIKVYIIQIFNIFLALARKNSSLNKLITQASHRLKKKG